MDVFLETERLILRRFTRDDADLLFDLYNDPAVMRYLNGGAPADRNEITALDLPAFLGYYPRFPGYGFWAALDRAALDQESRGFLGWFHFRPQPDDPLDEPELGYRLHRAAWGRGYATEGSRALLAKGFTDLGASRVTAATLTANLGSRRVLEKIGLRHLRTTPADEHDTAEGAERGVREYAITRAEWAALQQ
ncbi:GNAT family N-acetyltransferase [Amycolatopsis sp. NBC_00345]|uniref:GNAT family N-acetyltransferase n=1 Tax=Amycolatopsis sp. NBC_00345 TaxID=2975955 RepID=UPI002E27153D